MMVNRIGLQIIFYYVTIGNEQIVALNRRLKYPDVEILYKKEYIKWVNILEQMDFVEKPILI